MKLFIMLLVKICLLVEWEPVAWVLTTVSLLLTPLAIKRVFWIVLLGLILQLDIPLTLTAKYGGSRL